MDTRERKICSLQLNQEVYFNHRYLGIIKAKIISINIDPKTHNDIKVSYKDDKSFNLYTCVNGSSTYLKLEDLIEFPRSRKELYRLLKTMDKEEIVEYLRKCRDIGLIDINLPPH